MGKTIRLTNEQEEALSLVDSDVKEAIDKLLEDRDIYKHLDNIKNRLRVAEKKLIKLERMVYNETK